MADNRRNNFNSYNQELFEMKNQLNSLLKNTQCAIELYHSIDAKNQKLVALNSVIGNLNDLLRDVNSIIKEFDDGKGINHKFKLIIGKYYIEDAICTLQFLIKDCVTHLKPIVKKLEKMQQGFGLFDLTRVQNLINQLKDKQEEFNKIDNNIYKIKKAYKGDQSKKHLLRPLKVIQTEISSWQGMIEDAILYLQKKTNSSDNQVLTEYEKLVNTIEQKKSDYILAIQGYREALDDKNNLPGRAHKQFTS